MLDVAKLRLPSFDTDSDSLISDRQWTYTRPDGPSTEVSNICILSCHVVLIVVPKASMKFVVQISA